MKTQSATERFERLNAWGVESSTPAIRVARIVQLAFSKILYHIGVRGATTVARTLCRVVGNPRAVVLNATGARFEFPAYDSYYGHYLFGSRAYEPEIAWLLAAHADDPSAAFLDCGANYGYWSVVAASLLSGPVVAVELDQATIKWLRLNASASRRPISVVNAAIWDVDGVKMGVARHGRNQSYHAQVDPLSGEVSSKSIDSVVSDQNLDPRHLLVKLDVEGAELRALAGAVATAAQGACFVLEEHGADLECVTSRQLFDQGWNVAIFDEAQDRWKVATDVDAVRRIKLNRERGYNVLSWIKQPSEGLGSLLQ